MGVLLIVVLASLLIFFPNPLHGGVPYNGSITPGFEGTQSNYINNDGIFLESINKDFGFGFVTTPDSVTLFTLSIIHKSSSRIIWSANRASPVSNSDSFQFQDKGNVVLSREEGEGGGSEVWRLDNSGKNASRIELRDSGNLVVVSGDGASIWESFYHPTDTLISNQGFKQGMKLTSNASSSPSNITYVLEIKSGDMVLSVNSLTPQVYWSMASYSGRIFEKDGVVTSSSLLGNSWRFYDEKQTLLWQFLISDNGDDNSTWIAVLENSGVISFTSLGTGVSAAADSSTKIPNNQCATPEPCGSYYTCSGRTVCGCVSGLSRVRSDCKTGIDTSPCKKTENNATLSVKLVNAGDMVDYFALEFASPFTNNTNLDNCKEFCSNNCSCLGLFFQNSSGNCFLFDWIGSFKTSRGSGFVSYIKVVTTNDLGGGNKGDEDGKHFPYLVIIIVLVALFTISGLIFLAFRIRRRIIARWLASQETHSFVNILPGTSIRFSYKDLQLATRGFSDKLGQGGFGSVFKGTLPDGSHTAVKQLEGIGQGKKEFKAEVSTIGSIHHQNLVHLTGFCEERAHRLLVYEYLPNGSLERWIFRDHGDILLDWDARFNIAVGTAKGLAYLHEDCDARIIHCDIKPENILLDDDFNAKVSDFGLAKLMTREQSHVFTTLRGTRGYMAPEWITTYAISEKSDVYSYGMVLIELIRRRKNQEGLGSSNFPAYAFMRMREGLLIEDVDWGMEEEGVDVTDDERVQRAMKTAFWCIQEDMHLRPSMSRVVQMLEGVFHVVQPPSSSTLDPNRYTRLELRSISEESCGRTSSSVLHSELSGPR